MEEKKEIACLQAGSYRELVSKVNEINFSDSGHKILKDDIVSISKENGIVILIYYR